MEWVNRIAVAVADEHCLEEGVTNDATDRRSDRRNLAAVPSADDDASGHGLAAHCVSGQQIFASRTRQGRKSCGGVHHDKVIVLARDGSVHEFHRAALTEHLL